VVRTYYRRLIPDEVTTHPYEVTEDGQLKSSPRTNLKLLKLTNDELILSWDGTVAHYKRGWSWWAIGLAAVGAVLVAIVVSALKR
jgi:hypothetical protein